MLSHSGHFQGRQVVPGWRLEDVRHTGDETASATAVEEWVGARSSEGCPYRSGFRVCETADHVNFAAAGWLGQPVHVVREACVVVALFSSRPQGRAVELGAHADEACGSLAQALG